MQDRKKSQSARELKAAKKEPKPVSRPDKKAKQKKGFTGNRYSDEEKKTIVKFVHDHDAKFGRGGIATAQRKYKVSYIALRNWLMGESVSRKKGEGLEPVLSRMIGLKAYVKDLERDIKRLKRQFY